MKRTLSAIVVVISFFVSGAYSAPKKPLKFEITAMADGVDQTATEAGFRTKNWPECHLALTLYKASNGNGAEVRSAYFETAAEADRFLDWNLKRVAKVTERGEHKDAAGKTVGRRAVVSVKPGAWEVMWTCGSTFRSFLSSDLTVAMELEKQYEGPNSTKPALSGQ